MQKRARSKPRGARPDGRRMPRLLVALLLAGGCTATTDSGILDDGAYPNLASVPEQAAARSDAAQRGAAREALTADRVQAQAWDRSLQPPIAAAPPPPSSPSLATLYFRKASAHLDPAALSVLKEVAAIQKKHGQSLLLIGHADHLAEAMARADNARKALLDLGIAPSRIFMRGEVAIERDTPKDRKVEIYLEE